MSTRDDNIDNIVLKVEGSKLMGSAARGVMRATITVSTFINGVPSDSQGVMGELVRKLNGMRPFANILGDEMEAMQRRELLELQARTRELEEQVAILQQALRAKGHQP